MQADAKVIKVTEENMLFWYRVLREKKKDYDTKQLLKHTIQVIL